VLSGLLLIVSFYLVFVRGGVDGSVNSFPKAFGVPEKIGIELFTDYLLPFEVTSVLLLVAMVGAIVLTKGRRKANPDTKKDL